MSLPDYDDWIEKGGVECWDEKHPEKPERESESDDEGHY